MEPEWSRSGAEMGSKIDPWGGREAMGGPRLPKGRYKNIHKNMLKKGAQQVAERRWDLRKGVSKPLISV